MAGGVQLSRHLIEREVRDRAADPSEVAAALYRACARFFGNVRESMGDDGCRALCDRAFSRTEAHHPALHTLSAADCAFPVENILASIEIHGVDATIAAAEALLGALVDILVGLIGEDMSKGIIDPSGKRPGTFGGAESQ
jgi:hypothetical protein